MSWQIWFFYLTLLILLLTTSNPIWWLPLLSLALFALSFPPKRKIAVSEWHHWHPVFMTLVYSNLAPNLSRWVRYSKITGGDCLILLPTKRDLGLLLLDLSKNDLDTFLHFVWTRALIAYGWNHTKCQLLRLLENSRQISNRVDLSYLLGILSQNDAEWQSAGCFGVGWFNKNVKGQHQILPTLGRSFWKTRRNGVYWVFTTDGVAPYLTDVIESMRRDVSPEVLILTLSREDDLTLGWFVPKLKALNERADR
ncbi:MAG: hypothetical protein NZ805_15340 [Armatimonadetes bacterium]|nr:hypothetical protein [Armatimonadota bacterium]